MLDSELAVVEGISQSPTNRSVEAKYWTGALFIWDNLCSCFNYRWISLVIKALSSWSKMGFRETRDCTFCVLPLAVPWDDTDLLFPVMWWCDWINQSHFWAASILSYGIIQVWILVNQVIHRPTKSTPLFSSGKDPARDD
jgi:hypothetical protein